ncbi:MAG: L-serine ammonia-lyase, iron-sulfur-dependent, subunit beta [Tissierellia bacterium]|jgi:L-serine dehydratase|nr:L-serine ammonia-lyase, iron-sulfur-dependent subunit beta [Bacillota bacterium]NLK58604.1 L-serine ammonia-lyase, iron-sulfur-dependent, subunit beta [Tissierellia bacterium]
MKFISLFEVIGPNMIGPSSSHTAGAVAIGKMARRLLQKEACRVRFVLYGSFARTYRGHGTDRALLGGVMGYDMADERIRDAFFEADKKGLAYTYAIDEETAVSHPNTADVHLEAADGTKLSVRGESIGGGKIRITRIDGVELDFTGEYATLIVEHLDKPGVIAYLTAAFAMKGINIAFMRVFRKEQRKTAYAIMETDEIIPEEVVAHLNLHSEISKVILVQG